MIHHLPFSRVQKMPIIQAIFMRSATCLAAAAVALACTHPNESTGAADEPLATEPNAATSSSADPIRVFLKQQGYPVVSGKASLPNGSYERVDAYPLVLRDGVAKLPSAFHAPRAGFHTVDAATAERWIAGVITRIPGRDRADLVTLRSDAEFATSTFSSHNRVFAKRLLDSVGRNPRIATNMDFAGGFNDVAPRGSWVQGAVLLIGSNGALWVYAESGD
jgi:hypothetical protein